MPKIKYVKKANQRYAMVPVLDDDGKQQVVPVLNARTGEQKVAKGGRPVTRKVTVADKTKPLPARKCEKCGAEISVGSPFKCISIKRQVGGITRFRCMNCPNWQPWEYSNALWARIQQIQSEADTDMSGIEDEEDAKQKASDVAEAIRELASEKEEAADNLEEYFPGSENAENARSNADALSEWADNVENALDSVEFPDGKCANCDGKGSLEHDEHNDACPEDCDGTEECLECNGSGEGETVPEEELEDWRSEAQEALQQAIDDSPDTV